MENCYYGNKTENNENISVTSCKFVFHIKLCRNVRVQFLRCCRNEKTISVQYLNIVWYGKCVNYYLMSDKTRYVHSRKLKSVYTRQFNLKILILLLPNILLDQHSTKF